MPASVSDSQFVSNLEYISIKIKDFKINMLSIIPCFEEVAYTV